jgi:SAM-dependent methyltransferase
MFQNWINIHDLGRLKDKIVRGELSQAMRRVFLDAAGKTRAAWSHTRSPKVNVWEIPALLQRWNFLISGDTTIDHVEYICRRYLSGRKNLTAFSPGCGNGGNEMRWAATGLFQRIDAIDTSAPRIANAIDLAARNDLARILYFKVGDMALISGESQYDLVIAEGALHHFFPMRSTLGKIKNLLKPGGLLVVNDFVGPSRFQWTARQLQAANAMLALIPEAYKRCWPDGKIKKMIAAPGRLRMKLADPSEAAESSLIRPLLAEMFTTLEMKNKGGTITGLVFFEIAHHFKKGDETAERILRSCFALEDLLLQCGELSSDYILGVFQKPLS